jgi:hypothetical protein
MWQHPARLTSLKLARTPRLPLNTVIGMKVSQDDAVTQKIGVTQAKAGRAPVDSKGVLPN